MSEWGWPLIPAAVFSIIIIGPLIGVLLERLVFRPLEVAGASTAAKLAATMGVFVVVLGVVIATWGGTSKPAPSLITRTPINITDSLILGLDQIATIFIGLIVAFGLLVLLKYTRIGIATRAVVDRRELAELMSINANRVSSLAWALGTWLAGLAGVLLAPGLLLDTSTLLLFVLGSYACAVGGRLASLPLTYATAVAISVVDQLTIRFMSDNEFFQTIRPHYFFIAFLVLSLVMLDGVQEVGGGVVRQVHRRVAADPKVTVRNGALIAAGLVLLPFVLNQSQIGYAQRAVFFSVIFLSLVVLTGFSGQLNLGVAGFVGMGAFGAARLANDFGVPVMIAIPLAAVLFAVPVGVLVGFFAVRRRGLVLGLVTLATGVLLFSIAFQNLTLTGGVDGSKLARPTGFEGDRAFYLYELAMLGLLMVFARNLRSGRLGRVLTALRDNEEGARSIGLSLARYKLPHVRGVGGHRRGRWWPPRRPGRQLLVRQLHPVRLVVVVHRGRGGGHRLRHRRSGRRVPLRPRSGVRRRPVDAAHRTRRAHAGTPWRRHRGTHPRRTRSDRHQGPHVGPVPRPSAGPDPQGAGGEPVRPRPARIGSGVPCPGGIMTTGLVVDAITKTFGGLVAVSAVSLTVPPDGHVVGLIGPNGAGKTTLFNCITGYLTPDSGDVLLDGEPIVGLKPHVRAQRGIGRTFQRLATFDTMTVEENIQVAVETQSSGRLLRGFFRLRHPVDGDVRARTDELIELMRLEDVRDRPAGSLPTGLGRLVELGRALAIDPRYVLLDEPASGLDATETTFLEGVLGDVRDAGVSLLLVEHDVDLVLRLCEYIYVLDFGQPIAAGTPDEISDDPRVRAAYLGAPEEATL